MNLCYGVSFDFCRICSEKSKFLGKELRENAPLARGSVEAEFTQFLTQKSILLSTLWNM